MAEWFGEYEGNENGQVIRPSGERMEDEVEPGVGGGIEERGEEG